MKIQLDFNEDEYDHVFPLLVDIVKGHPITIRILSPNGSILPPAVVKIENDATEPEIIEEPYYGWN